MPSPLVSTSTRVNFHARAVRSYGYVPTRRTSKGDEVTKDDGELWDMVCAAREGILATIGADGMPHLTNVNFLADADARVVRFTTTTDRAKGRNLLRDPRASRASRLRRGDAGQQTDARRDLGRARLRPHPAPALALTREREPSGTVTVSEWAV